MRKKKCVALPTSVLPRLRIMCGRDATLGPGRVQLLELIGETGSLRAAAGQLGMAYITAWMHVKALNRRFRSPVVLTTRGGKTGGGAVLTDMGRRVVALYHRMEQQSHAAIQEGFREFQALLKQYCTGNASRAGPPPSHQRRVAPTCIAAAGMRKVTRAWTANTPALFQATMT